MSFVNQISTQVQNLVPRKAKTTSDKQFVTNLDIHEECPNRASGELQYADALGNRILQTHYCDNTENCTFLERDTTSGNLSGILLDPLDSMLL